MDGLDAIPIIPKTGDEAFVSSGEELQVCLSDFWSWGYSDLVNNVTRGVLAEFLVAHALGISTDDPRVQWDAIDLVAPDGTKIEVKSSSYVQSWKQPGYSDIRFDIRRRKRAGDASADTNLNASERFSDVYVFCLLDRKCKDVDPMNIDHWEFYVVSARILDEKFEGQESMSLPTLRSLASPVEYDRLKDAVEKAVEASQTGLGLESGAGSAS